MLKLATLISFMLSDVLLLVCTLSGGLLLFTALSGEMSGGTSTFAAPLLSKGEIIEAFGIAAMFMILSGYIVSVVVLSVIFRDRLVSFARAAWLILLFVLHAGVFLFYLRGPAVYTTSALLIAVGVVCVFSVILMEYFLWRAWLRMHLRSNRF